MAPPRSRKGAGGRYSWGLKLNDAERALFRGAAEAEGLPLGAWIKRSCRDAAAMEARVRAIEDDKRSEEVVLSAGEVP